MKIAFDIFDTLGDATSTLVDILNREYNKEYSLNSLLDMYNSGQLVSGVNNLTSVYGLSSKGIDTLTTLNAREVIENMTAFPEALVLAKTYYTMGAEIFYLVDIDKELEDCLTTWLFCSGFPDGKIISTMDKVETIQKERVQLLYDDSSHDVSRLEALGVECVVVNSLSNISLRLPSVKRVDWNKTLASKTF